MKKKDDISYSFTNELDNEINLSLKNKYDRNDVKNFHGVSVKMKGPKTYIDDTFTYRELKELNHSLDKILEDQESEAKDYSKPRKKSSKRWSSKYKKSINCNNPKGFSQKQYCKRKKSGGKYKESRALDLQRIHKAASVPYTESGNLRKFSSNTNPEDLIWHRDDEDRKIHVLSGNNWMLQFDNEIPTKLEIGKDYFINKNSWHRILKGEQDFVIKISSNNNIYDKQKQRSVLLENAKKIFGITQFIEQAGYLLADGTMLDFSGGGGFERVLDHRGIEGAFDGEFEKFIPSYDKYSTSRTDVMNHFMVITQAIRIMLYDDGIGFDIETSMTEEQKSMIESITRDIKRYKKLDWIQVMKRGEQPRMFDSYEISEAKRYMSGDFLFSNNDSFEEMIDKIQSCSESEIYDLNKVHDVRIKNLGNDAYELDFSNSYFKFEFKNSKNYSDSKYPHILIFENGSLDNIEDWVDENEEYLNDYDLDEKYKTN